MNLFGRLAVLRCWWQRFINQRREFQTSVIRRQTCAFHSPFYMSMSDIRMFHQLTLPPPLAETQCSWTPAGGF